MKSTGIMLELHDSLGWDFFTDHAKVYALFLPSQVCDDVNENAAEEHS